MLIQSQTRAQLSKTWEVVNGVAITEEGLALVLVNDGGVAKVRPSTGGADEVFAGVSISHTMIPTNLPSITQITAVGTTLTLPFQPITGQLRLESPAGTAFTIGTGAPGSAGTAQYSGTGTTVTLNAADSGKTFIVSLIHAATVEQAVAFAGEGFPGQLSRQSTRGHCGVYQTGLIATTNFSLSNAFTAGKSVTLAANGLFNGDGGSGTELPRAIVRSVPSVGSPYLILDLLPA